MNQPGTDLCSLLAAQAALNPDKAFVHFQNTTLNYSDAELRSAHLAAGFQSRGVEPGNVVATLLPNSEEAILSWFACNHIGAIWAPLNSEFRGVGLAKAIQLLDAELLIVHKFLLPALFAAVEDASSLPRICVVGEWADSPAGAELIRFEKLFATGRIQPRESAESDTSLLIFTSGTSGPSKACSLSHHYVILQARMMIECAELTPDDVLYCPYPLFHLDATALTTIPALLLGATAVIPERFSVSRFWQDIRKYGCTTFDFMGATLGFIFKQDERPDDAEHPARLGWGVPMPPFRHEFEQRFGVRLMEGYGATECGCPVWQFPGEEYPEGSCGRCHPAYEVSILGEDDQVLAPGEVGEICVRPKNPAGIMKGYYQDGVANSKIFRIPGAVCMGDKGRMDEDGNLWFEGRREDAIRRRGENIAPSEIEEVIDRHDAILEVAAYGIPSDYGEEEVAVAVALKPGLEITPGELIDWCRGKMARHMVPVAVRIYCELPKTPTRKIARNRLREIHFTD